MPVPAERLLTSHRHICGRYVTIGPWTEQSTVPHCAAFKEWLWRDCLESIPD